MNLSLFEENKTFGEMFLLRPEPASGGGCELCSVTVHLSTVQKTVMLLLYKRVAHCRLT